MNFIFFFFQAEDGIRDRNVTGVQTCALPICAEMRQAMGVAVFSGMIGVTLFGLFLTPVFYTVLMKLGRRKATAPIATSGSSALGTTHGATAVTTIVLLLTAVSLVAGPFTAAPD